MKALQLNEIDKPFFGYRDISRVLNITPESARVSAHRYIQKGILVRVKPNIFVLADRWKNYSNENRFEVANILQVPSYISLTTALEYYGITTQIQRDYMESISIKRTTSKTVDNVIFRYTKLRENLYFAFEKRENFYIAKAEKAILDSFYLVSLGRYSLDIAAIDRSKIDGDKLDLLSAKFPDRTKKLLRNYGFIV